MEELIVCNQRRVSEFLGFEIKDGDILNNKKCKEFIKKYQKFFENPKVSSFKRFYKETGLRLTIAYINPENPFEKIAFNELGSNIESVFPEAIYNHDILVINKPSSIVIDDKYIKIDDEIKYIRGSNIGAIINERKYRGIRYELSVSKSIKDKKKIIENMYEQNYILKDNIKQIYLNSFGNLFVLYDDGTLYENDKIYANNVSGIWDANSYVCFLIFKDHHLEYLSNSYDCYHNEKCDKIVYTDFYIALKRKNRLEIINVLEENDTNFHAFFSNVTDISYGSNEKEIVLKNNSEIIYYYVAGFIEKHK